MRTRLVARIRKACAAVLFWHQKSTQKSAAVPHAADPCASQGAPAGTSVYPIHVRRSGLANAKSKAFAFTASRAQPIARRPPWAGESNRFARRRTPPSHPNGPAKAGPRQNANHSYALPAMQVPAPCGPAQSRPVAKPESSARIKGDARNTSTHLTRGLGGKAPIGNHSKPYAPRRAPHAFGAAMETPHPVRGVGLRRRPRCVSIGAAPCFRRRGLGASEHRRSENSALFIS